MFKKCLKVFLVEMVFLLLFSCPTFGLTISNDNYFIEKILKKNSKLMVELLADTTQTSDEEDLLFVKIGYNKDELKLEFGYKNEKYGLSLDGDYSEVKTKNGIGYIGVYQGTITPADNDNIETDEEGRIPVVADVVFNKNDVFVTLTIGYASDNEPPLILYYGEMTNELQNLTLSKVCYDEKNNMNTKNEVTYVNKNVSLKASADTSFTYKGKTNIVIGSYNVGTLSVFQAKEFPHGGFGTVCAKVNTNSVNIKEYVKTIIGTATMYPTVSADQFTISICGNNSGFHAGYNMYTPSVSTNKASIKLPYYYSSSFQFMDLEVEVSSVKINESSVGNRYPNIRVEWVIYKNGGWVYNSLDGDEKKNVGMSVYTMYTHEGPVSENINTSLTYKASIRYLYWTVSASGALVPNHVTTKVASKIATTTILF